MKTIAIMQPYFFPYIGYWQLIHAVDRFVIFDDVNYIVRGWVNRNRILINGKPAYITVPLHQASQNKKICDITLQSPPNQREKLTKTIEVTYRKTPYFDVVFPVVEKLICHEAHSLSDYLAHQLKTLSAFMGVTTEFVGTSRCYQNNGLKGQARLIDICKREGASTYINPQGGQAIYDNETFRNANIDLRFIVMRPMPYKQRSAEFIPYLSIIDALMEIGPREIMHYLDAYELRKAGGIINNCK